MEDPSPVTLRAATPEDLAAMARAKRDAGVAAWPHILPPALIGQLPFLERWSGAVTHPPARTRVLVAEQHGAVVAFAITRPSADDDADGQIGELDGFYAAPAVWGRGVGRRLLVAAVEGLREDGFSHATLWTAADNHRPRRIYETAGWRLDGTVRHRHLGGAEFDELRYRLRL
ncbi:MAG TPA: GNAT family N-acetyltransferase [Candidatus Limnocylindrales bacterium]|nr:GNAT family N-acetyltransferase [Candidatus Limnocylindrales bacterium]